MYDDEVMEIAGLCRALGNPHRVKIMKILSEQPEDSQCMVGSIVEQLSISQSTVSQHLKQLKEVGLIKGRIEGPSVCYCLDEDALQRLRYLMDNLEAYR